MKNILIVEDLEEVADWLSGIVTDIFPEAHLVLADNLATAQAALAAYFDLALIDIGLPDGKGTHLINELKQRNPDTLCVITTIFDDPGHLFPALRAGADGYLLKDDPEDEFTSALQGIVAGRPPISASIARMMLQQFRPTPKTDFQLTTREEDMLVLIANGFSVKQAAQSLGIKENTAASYLKSLYQKLRISNRAEATLRAVQIGLINPERD